MQRNSSGQPDYAEALAWKLQLPGMNNGQDFDRLQRLWEELEKHPNKEQFFGAVAQVIGKLIFHDALKHLATARAPADQTTIEFIRRWALANPDRSARLLSGIRQMQAKSNMWEALKSNAPAASFAAGGLPNPGLPGFPPIQQPPPLPPAFPAGSPALARDASVPDFSAPPPSAAALWKYVPLAADTLDAGPDAEHRELPLPSGATLMAARVRGKKHKHDGTPCDDSFHFDTAGCWTIIAVSDGAGSKRFSRVGSAVATQAVVAVLKAALQNHQIRTRSQWTGDSFTEDDLVYVQESLVKGFEVAWRAVQQAAEERAQQPEYTKVLGRQVTPNDLSATLLVAVHCEVPYQGGNHSLVFGCSVGDGMIAIIDQDAGGRILMTPDSGEHSGETRFLDARESTPESVRSRIFPFLGKLRCLLLMTDGVADDYFPNQTEMPRLYGDLVLNGILPIAPASEAEIEHELQKSRAPNLRHQSPVAYSFETDRQTASGPERVLVRSMEKFAALVEPDMELASVAANPRLLAAGAAPRAASSAAALEWWLDSYQVRGSFDDRTLAALVAAPPAE